MVFNGKLFRGLGVAAFVTVVLYMSLAQALVAGVPKELEADYAIAEQSGRFQCRDQSKTVPFSSVNDDYCDCPDGSDEPGTSACIGLNINGAMRPIAVTTTGFLCVNSGYTPQHISLSQVGDGICDCCDGSDEAPRNHCPNFCEESERNRKAQLESELQMLAKAAKARAAMKAQAERARADKAKEAPILKARVAQHEAQILKLEAALPALEKEQELKRAEMKQAYDAWTTAHQNGVTDASSAVCVGWYQTGKCKPDGPAEPENDRDCSDVIKEHHSGYCECIPASSDSLVASDEENEPAKVRHGFSCKHAPLTCSYVCAHEGKPGLREDTAPPDGSSYILPALSQQRQALKQEQDELETTKANLSEIEATLARPLGTEDLLRTLAGQSFTLDHQDYTYELVLFQNTYQHNKGSKGGPSLGAWQSFADSTYSSWAKDAFDLSQMLYTKGARCWNGIVRSTDVHVVCNAENRLALIEEPSMCKYKMVFETPAMCEE